MYLTEKDNPAMVQSLLNGGGHSAKITTGGDVAFVGQVRSFNFCYFHSYFDCKVVLSFVLDSQPDEYTL